MKREYADKINSLLQCFHFNKEFLEWNHDYSHQLLRHGVSHLYHFAMLQGENDEVTLEELRNIIIVITNGDITKPYDLFFKPLAVTVEVTPEMLQQLKQSATVSAQMKRQRLY